MIVFTTGGAQTQETRGSCWIQSWQEWCLSQVEGHGATYARDSAVPVVRR
jgi:hypothetical protein